MAKILVTGLNPAWQQIFTLPALRVGEVNRAGGYVELASGKGLNAAKVLAAHGHEVSLLQILAGDHGNRILAACEHQGIRSLHVIAAGDTRVCSTLLHEGDTTEVIAPYSLDSGDVAERLLTQIPQESFEALLVCGSLPAGLDESIYVRVVERISAPLVIWDSVAGLTREVLPRISWLKVNAEEHRRLAPLINNAPDRISQLVTDGPRPAHVTIATRSIPIQDSGKNPDVALCHVPRLDAIVNPIGAGDTVTAMLTDGLLRGLEPRTAVARALAAAAASCLNVLPAVWNPDDQSRIERDVFWSVSGAS